MTVTKQQQLEFAAMHIDKWKSGYDFAVIEKTNDGRLCVRWPSICSGGVSKKEWQQERDKMQKQGEKDNSWHERGELPPVGCECDFCNSDDEWSDWHKCVFVGFDSDGNGVVSVFGDEKGMLWISNKPSDFRPLRTEREKAIDAACAAVGGVGEDGLLIIERLYDAGMLK